MITCTRKLYFDYGHRVYRHESKCAHCHGHRGTVSITALAPELDHLGRVIDFGVLKERIGGWLDRWWDHGMLLFEEDPIADLWREDGPLKNHKVYFLADNPTAENMAKHLGEEICPFLLRDTEIKITKVVVWETPNCSATWQLS